MIIKLRNRRLNEASQFTIGGIITVEVQETTQNFTWQASVNLIELPQTDVPNNYYTFIKNVMYESTIKAAEGNTVAVVRNVTLIKDVCFGFKQYHQLILVLYQLQHGNVRQKE